MHRRIDQIAGLLLAITLTAPSAAMPPSELSGFIRSVFARSGLPGVEVAVVANGRPAYAVAMGGDGKGGTVTPDTPFILGSTSKAFTALAILQLAEAGRLNIDAPAARYLPGFLHGAPDADRMTLRMLLNQTSGLSHEAGDQPVLDAGVTGPHSIQDFARGLDASALDRTPGESFEYSNANYAVLGAIVERASGQSYARYLDLHVFKPLGMTHSRAVAEGPMARGHKRFFGWFYVSDLPYPTSFVPAGFVVSTANDIAKYLAAQLPGSPDARKLGLSDAGIALWHKGVAPIDLLGKAHYAMGWATDTFNGLPVVFHNGDTGVFSSEFAFDPARRNAVAVLSNGSGWLAGDYLHEIASGVLNQMAGRAPRDDTFIHRMIFGIYFAVMAVPVLQVLALWLARRRKAGIFGRIWPAALHVLAAAGLLYAFPRDLIGIPFAELLTSFPDMAAAALVSGACAVAALVQAIWFQARSSADSPRSTASASPV